MKVHGRRIATSLVWPQRRILGVVEDTVWIAPCGPNVTERRLLGFDATTLAPRGEIALRHALETTPALDGGLFAHSQLLGQVEVVDLSRRERVELAVGDKAHFHGFAGGLLVVTAAGAEAPEIRLCDPRTGTVVQTARVAKLGAQSGSMVFVAATGLVVKFGGGLAGVRVGAKGTRPAFEEVLDGYSTVAATRDGDRVVAIGQSAVVCIDVATCRVAWRTRLPPSAVGDGISCVRIRGERADVIAYVERASGPALLLTAIALDTGELAPVVERANRFADLPARVYTSEAPLPRADIVDRTIEIHRVHDRAPVRLPLPTDSATATLLDGDRLFVLGRELCAIDLASLPADATDVGLDITTVPTTTPSDVPAEVTFVGQSSVVIVQHPTYGRARISRDSGPLAAGDRVMLEDVTTLPGNVVRVGGWHRASGTAAPVRLMVLELPASALPPRTPDPDAGRDVLYDPPPPARPASAKPRLPLGPLVAPIERLFGERLPLLHKLVAACDAEPNVRRWWDQIGCAFALDFEPPEDDASVDRLERLGFAPFTTHDGMLHYGVVHNATRDARGVAALSPQGDHELWWDADGFDEWLARRLAEAAETKPSVVTLLLEALELDATFPSARRARMPAWFGG